MRVISFDVGIKNLACCVFESDSNGNMNDFSNYKILFWDVINLTCPIEYPACCHDGCKVKKIMYVYNATNKYYCTRHAKKTELGIIPEEYHENKLNKIPQKDLFELANQFNLNPIKPTTKKVLLVMLSNHFKDIHLVPIPKDKKASEMDLIDIGRQMKIAFKERLLLYEPYNHVIIENQISPIASRMKTIQGMIAYHFILSNSDTVIKFVSAANKLNTFTDEKIAKYSDRKKVSIIITNQLLAKYDYFSPYIKYLEKNSKKDDLADCFLQGLWYLKKYNI